MIKYHPRLDMVRILIVYYECFTVIYYNKLLLSVNVPSTDNTEEHSSSSTDDKTPPSSGYG